MASFDEEPERIQAKATAGNGERQAKAANPRIEITPSVAQYEQLCRDLAALREAGAPSNTAAIIGAVHAAVKAPMLGAVRGSAGRRNVPAPQ